MRFLIFLFSLLPWQLEGILETKKMKEIKAPPTPVPPSPIIRLMPEEDYAKGRAEMLVNGEWGSICDRWYHPKGWPNSFCYQLGFPGSLYVDYAINMDARYQAPENTPIARHSPHFCQNSLQIPLDLCEVHEKGECNHTQDIYIECATKIRCAEGHIRNETSKDGVKFMSCVPEMFKNGMWGRICDTNPPNFHWQASDKSWAWAFCREIGMPFVQDLHRVIDVIPDYNHEQSFALKTPNCQIPEGYTKVNDLELCQSNYDEAVGSCDSSDEYYITCAASGVQKGNARCASGKVSSTYNQQGVKILSCIPELFRSNTWGRICDIAQPTFHWEHEARSWAWTFCRQLGYPELLDLQRAVDALAYYMNNLPRTLMNPQCQIPEGKTMVESLDDCDSDISVSDCDSQEEYYITCASSGVHRGYVRCANGYTHSYTNASDVRMVACVPELYRDDTWGRICDSYGATDLQILQDDESSWVWAFCHDLGFLEVAKLQLVKDLYKGYGHDMVYTLANPICGPPSEEGPTLKNCEEDNNIEYCDREQEIFITCGVQNRQSSTSHHKVSAL